MSNGHGGVRQGAGRKSAREEYEPDGGQTPLAFLLEMLRDETNTYRTRFEAAKAAAPYCHARLQNTELNVDADLTISLISYLDDTESEDT